MSKLKRKKKTPATLSVKKVKEAPSTTRASLEAQLAEIEAKIAALDGSGQRAKNSDHCLLPTDHCSDHCSLPTAHSLRAKLAAPANLLATPVGSSFLRVSWNTVIGAKGYLLQYSSDSSFVNDVHAIIVDAPTAAITLSGLKPDTMYHVKVKSLADSGDTDSDFSMAYLVRTGIATGGETATHLQSWLAGQQSMFQDFATLLPELDTIVLTPGDRRRLNGSGVRRYGFIDKVSDVAIDYPQFWPAVVTGGTSGAGNSIDFQDRLKERLREIEALRNLLVWSNFVARTVRDLLLVAGDDAFRMANVYYMTVRTAARSHLPEAQHVFAMIESFWQRPRKMSQEPTQKEELRNFKGLQRGTKVGKMYIENEADRVVKGKKTVIDETQRKPRNNFKEVETGIADLSEE